MRLHRLICGLLLVGWMLGGWPVFGEAATSLAALQAKINGVVDQAAFANASWGIKVFSLDTGNVLYERNSHQLLSPASNTKLFTVACALDRLGPEYRIETSLYSTAHPSRHGNLHGDLVIIGRGDFGFRAHALESEPYAALGSLVAAITNAGIRHIQGNLVGENGFFQGPDVGAGWGWDDSQYNYGARISALTIMNNSTEVSVAPGKEAGQPCRVSLASGLAWPRIVNKSVTLTNGAAADVEVVWLVHGANEAVLVRGGLPVDHAAHVQALPVQNPAVVFVGLLRETLQRHGVRVSGKDRITNSLCEANRAQVEVSGLSVGKVYSVPLRTMAEEILKPSQNLYASLLLRHLGESTRTTDIPARQTSEQLGILELNRFLAEAGIPTQERQFEEGSGLSRNNLVTAHAIVRLLEYMSQHPYGASFRQALPVAGTDGTLASRMKGTVAEGRVSAKTGTLRWAHTLSGYVTTAAGERLAFSLLLNRAPVSSASAREALDAIAVELAGFGERSSVAR